MTIKYRQNNISAEAEEVITNVSINNGILSFTKTNQSKKDGDSSRNDSNSLKIDLKDIKLRLVKMESKQDLDALKLNDLTSINNIFTSSPYNYESFESIDEVHVFRETNIFLVPQQTSNSNEEGVYREYIWVENGNNSDFEAIGSTSINLNDYLLIHQANDKKGLNVIVDSSTGDITFEDKNNHSHTISDIPIAAITDGDTNHVPTCDSVYDELGGKEDISNKSSSISTDTGSTTKYPTVKAVEDYSQPKGNYLTEHQTLKTINNQSIIGTGNITVAADVSGKEDTSNKSNSIIIDTGSTTRYPTVYAVEDYAQPKGNYLTQHQDISGKLDSQFTGNDVASKNVVTDSNGNIVLEEKTSGGTTLDAQTQELLDGLTPINVLVTYTDNSTETITLLKYEPNSGG